MLSARCRLLGWRNCACIPPSCLVHLHAFFLSFIFHPVSLTFDLGLDFFVIFYENRGWSYFVGDVFLALEFWRRDSVYWWNNDSKFACSIFLPCYLKSLWWQSTYCIGCIKTLCNANELSVVFSFILWEEFKGNVQMN